MYNWYRFSGASRNPTGVALLKDNAEKTAAVFVDSEILEQQTEKLYRVSPPKPPTREKAPYGNKSE